MSDADFTAIGVDVGGTKIAAAVLKFPEGAIRARKIVPTHAQRGGEAVLNDVARIVNELAADLRIDGIGVGLCEIVNTAGDIASANCLDWSGTAVRERLSKIAPAVIEADVRAAARAEAMFGAGRNVDVFLFVSIGTGISSCVVIEGEPFKGARGASGTMASGPMPGASDALLPTLEELASGPALVSRFTKMGGKATSGEDVLAAAARADASAVSVVESGAAALGASIGALVNVLDPTIVILGGGLGLSDGLYRESLVKSARRHIWWPAHRDLSIVAATTGADAGVIGAAATAWIKASQ